jgi:hypothetical protein
MGDTWVPGQSLILTTVIISAPTGLAVVSGRSRALYLLLVAVTVALGLATRRFRGALPDAVGAYGGDVLWAAMVYLLAAALWPRASVRRLAAGAAIFSLAIELGQLYHAPWIDAVRHTRFGGLVLGFGFLWSDLVCYAAGIALAAALDLMLTRRSPIDPAPPSGSGTIPWSDRRA